MILIHPFVFYIGRISKGRAMLTTAKYDDYYELGTICAGDSKGYRPTKWVDSNSSPGICSYPSHCTFQNDIIDTSKTLEQFSTS